MNNLNAHSVLWRKKNGARRDTSVESPCMHTTYIMHYCVEMVSMKVYACVHRLFSVCYILRNANNHCLIPFFFQLLHLASMVHVIDTCIQRMENLQRKLSGFIDRCIFPVSRKGVICLFTRPFHFALSFMPAASV